MKKLFYSITTLVVMACTSQVAAQDEMNSEKLANELSNPVASIINVPFSNNLDVGIGKYQGSKFISNIQPVIPLYSKNKLNIVSRTIIPLIDQHDITGEGSRQAGMGDINFSSFISPIGTKVIWGVGPSLTVPTATNKFLGEEKWAIGPTAVALRQGNGITYGALLRQTWSVGGSKDRSTVNILFAQPFLFYNFKSGAGLSISSDMFHDFETETFTGYLNVMASMVSVFGKQPVSFNLGPKIPLNSQTAGDWGIKATVTLVFMKNKK